MGISIKNDSVESAIRELARRTNQGVTEAVDDAVRAALARLADDDQARAHRRRAAWASARELLGSVGPIDRRAVDEQMYDEHGLPR